MSFLCIFGVILGGDTLGDFLDNFEPILDALDLDTAFTHRALGKGYFRSCFF